MSTQVQYRRGTATENNAFTGALAEITVDTTNWSLRVHNGATAGGAGNIATVAYVDAQLAALSANSITDGTSNVKVYNNANIAVSVAGTANVVIFKSTGANVTGTLDVSGNITGGNLVTAGLISATGNVSGGNLNVTGNIVDSGALTIITGASGNVNLAPNGTTVLVATTTGANITGTFNATGNITGGNLSATTVVATTLTGTLSTAAQTNITSVGTLTSLGVTGNISGGNITTAGNLAIPTATANTNTTQAATTAFVVGQAGALTPVTIGTAAVGTSLRYAREDHTHGGVGSAVAGTGISVSAATGAVTFTNTGVTSAVAGTNISVSGATGAVTIAVTGTVPTATTAATVTTAAQPNITSVGTLTGLTINNATTAITNGATTGTGNIGASGATFNTIFAKATSAQYADLAEMYQGDQSYMPGTVVEFGGTQEITITTTESSTRIAGVVSTNPSYLMNSGLATLNSVPVALTGRVPCQVLGPVRKGDRLVSSVLPGVAQTLDETIYRPGCMIGKSLEDWSESTVKLIEVVVGRL
jgi:hypothetical protein